MSLTPDPENETKPSWRRSRITLVLVLVALLAVGLVFVGWSHDEVSTPPAMDESVAAAPVVEVAPAPEAVAAAASEPTVKSRAEGGADQVEICKGFWVVADADGKPNQQAFGTKAARAEQDALVPAVAALSSSRSARDQAAAAFLLVRRWASDKGQREACRERGCTPEADASGLPVDPGALDRLVQSAQVTDDSQVYAWAYQACGFLRGSPACLPIQATQWTRIDPDNAVPWLALAEEAHRQKDAPGEADAMFHVGSATRYEAGFGTLAGTVLDRVPGGAADPVGSFAVAVYAMGIEAATQPGWASAMAFCATGELADANRKESCDRIATVLAEHADTALARNMGAVLGKRLGWSSERLATFTEANQADMQLAMMVGGTPASTRAESCDGLQVQLDRIRDFGRYGELETMRRAIKASGSTVSKLASAFRQTMATIQVEAAREAASAASNASNVNR